METGTQEEPKHRRIADIQRARLVAAMVEVCGERGASRVGVAHVVARAGVSRRTFYELFEDCESCLLSALEEVIDLARTRVLEAHDAALPWQAQVRASLIALLQHLEDEPARGHFLIVGSQAAGREAEKLRAGVVEEIVTAVDSGRGEAERASVLPGLTAEAAVGGALFVLQQKMSEARAPALLGLVNPLMSIIVLPYLGGAAAGAELTQTVPKRQRERRARRDPLAGIDIRLTYRTVRVLSAIAGNPGSSNREVGKAAGVSDPGQISKLLARLQRLGLVKNREATAPKGAPNAWVLTPKGGEVERAIAVHAGPLT
ncbi:MAG TPA: TetR family transcriptional regulator [Solirubrobacteraceae bacterium]|jgi:AcrR family transcriptional regulator|nr:TetR family transcriptional regulator [Solirubrobacteraceae bacterium]